MRRHDEMRKQGLLRRLVRKGGQLGNDTVRAQAGQQLQLGAARGLGALISEVHDLAVHGSLDRTMRFVDEALQVLRMPMVPSRLLVVAVHALLHHRPFAVVSNEEPVQVEIEAVLDSGAVDLGYEAARTDEPSAVETDALAQLTQFVWRLPRMLPPSAADVDAKLAGKWFQSALEGADNTGGDAGRVPVHAHDCTERLEPEWMRESLKEFIPAVMVDNRLSDDGAERRHACRQPGRYPPAMQGKNRGAGTSCHFESHNPCLPKAYQAGVVGSGQLIIVRNVIEYLGASTTGILCSHICRDAPVI